MFARTQSETRKRRKREVVLPKDTQPGYVFRTTLSTKSGQVKGVLCHAFLPIRATDPLRLDFHPTAKQAHTIKHLLDFSLQGTARMNGLRNLFSSSRVWSRGISSGLRTGIPFVSTFTGDPEDFRIVTVERGSKLRAPINGGVFWLTPSVLINTVLRIESWPTGNVKVRAVIKPKFTLQNGTKLVFRQYFKNTPTERGETLRFAELVAEFKPPRTKKVADISQTVEELEDFLALVSLATRHRCVCLGWEYFAAAGLKVKHYRRALVIPEPREVSTNETLIDIADFPEFIKTAYRAFGSFREKNLFKNAIYPLVDDKARNRVAIHETQITTERRVISECAKTI